MAAKTGDIEDVVNQMIENNGEIAYTHVHGGVRNSLIANGYAVKEGEKLVLTRRGTFSIIQEMREELRRVSVWISNLEGRTSWRRGLVLTRHGRSKRSAANGKEKVNGQAPR